MSGARPSYQTLDGVVVPAATSAEMREVLRIASDHTGPGLLPLIENAGRTAALATLDRGHAVRRALVIAGAGLRGAVAVGAARHLVNRGVEVQVVTITPVHQSDGALGQQFLALAETPARVTRWDDAFSSTDADALIEGITEDRAEGAPWGIEMGLVRAAEHAAAAGVPVLSLDVPSGVQPDSGDVPGFAVRATQTLALGLPRPGLRRERAGDLWVADLGIPAGVYARAGIVVTPFFGPSDRVPLRYPDEA